MNPGSTDTTKTTGATPVPISSKPAEVASQQQTPSPNVQQNVQTAPVDPRIKTLTDENTSLKGINAKLVSDNQKLTKDIQPYVDAKKEATKVIEEVSKLPAIGTKGQFLNHAGYTEPATVIGHGVNSVNLEIQGANPTDKYKKNNVPLGGPTEKLTFSYNK